MKEGYPFSMLIAIMIIFAILSIFLAFEGLNFIESFIQVHERAMANRTLAGMVE